MACYCRIGRGGRVRLEKPTEKGPLEEVRCPSDQANAKAATEWRCHTGNSRRTRELSLAGRVNEASNERTNIALEPNLHSANYICDARPTRTAADLEFDTKKFDSFKHFQKQLRRSLSEKFDPRDPPTAAEAQLVQVELHETPTLARN
ncbi:hypothetical protein BIW11_11608 [Tropilaelaps mercedesae]|uniref:Uncharacterized protein n=1 Tax=Tropilaelaps mercedesae TaxID=418985 RepID=A0A1V9XAB5_9ACAR|nr:hypothetical protein BIW11_11608 [Tropilaelaps mercedesae]